MISNHFNRIAEQLIERLEELDFFNPDPSYEVLPLTPNQIEERKRETLDALAGVLEKDAAYSSYTMTRGGDIYLGSKQAMMALAGKLDRLDRLTVVEKELKTKIEELEKIADGRMPRVHVCVTKYHEKVSHGKNSAEAIENAVSNLVYELAELGYNISQETEYHHVL
uniref:Uncharacterized protein n=1 Tax=Ochrobactrum phage ORM_20 TaxID=2985243 RepID=A0A9N6ZGB1_9VIRU|nr:hypothetical protein ORM20_00145 [Ochrobactrum phage ORM_20]